MKRQIPRCWRPNVQDREYAESLVSNHAIVVRACLASLPSKGETVLEETKIVDDFYQATASDEVVAADPKGHAMDYVHIILDIEKTTAPMSS